jgi:hypothetical protein
MLGIDYWEVCQTAPCPLYSLQYTVNITPLAARRTTWALSAPLSTRRTACQTALSCPWTRWLSQSSCPNCLENFHQWGTKQQNRHWLYYITNNFSWLCPYLACWAAFRCFSTWSLAGSFPPPTPSPAPHPLQISHFDRYSAGGFITILILFYCLF